MVIKKLTPTMIQTIILSLLLLIAPFAMMITPPEGFCDDQEGMADPLYIVRAGLIGFGLIAAVLSIALMFWEIVRKDSRVIQSGTLLQIFMTFCIVAIGWAALPFWANGVFQAYYGNGPQDCVLSAYDPKSLMPMIWIGEVWYLGTSLILLFLIFPMPLLFVLNIAICIQDKNWRAVMATTACMAIPAFTLLPSGYGAWFID